jgi:primosomal protein N'
MPKQTEQQKADKALYRSLAAQALVLAVSGSGKPERYLAFADACEQCAARARERAEQ